MAQGTVNGLSSLCGSFFSFAVKKNLTDQLDCSLLTTSLMSVSLCLSVCVSVCGCVCRCMGSRSEGSCPSKEKETKAGSAGGSSLRTMRCSTTSKKGSVKTSYTYHTLKQRQRHFVWRVNDGDLRGISWKNQFLKLTEERLWIDFNWKFMILDDFLNDFGWFCLILFWFFD